jgi:hypothetical protein
VVSRGRDGESIASIRVTKDRHGFIREWAQGTGRIGSIHVGVPDGPKQVIIVTPRLSEGHRSEV